MAGSPRGKKKGQKSAKINKDRKIQVETYWAADGSEVRVEVKGFSFRGFENQLVVAANEFAGDWGKAYPLRCAGFEPGVDNGNVHSGYLAGIEANERLRRLKTTLGEREYAILVAVVIGGFGPHELERAGGPNHKLVTEEIKRILRNVGSFYSGNPPKVDPLLLAAHRVMLAMADDREVSLADMIAIKPASGGKHTRSEAAAAREDDLTYARLASALSKNDWTILGVLCARVHTALATIEEKSRFTTRLIALSLPVLLQHKLAQFSGALYATTPLGRRMSERFEAQPRQNWPAPGEMESAATGA